MWIRCATLNPYDAPSKIEKCSFKTSDSSLKYTVSLLILLLIFMLCFYNQSRFRTDWNPNHSFTVKPHLEFNKDNPLDRREGCFCNFVGSLKLTLNHCCKGCRKQFNWIFNLVRKVTVFISSLFSTPEPIVTFRKLPPSISASIQSNTETTGYSFQLSCAVDCREALNTNNVHTLQTNLEWHTTETGAQNHRTAWK